MFNWNLYVLLSLFFIIINISTVHGKPSNCTQDELIWCAQPLAALQDSGLNLVDNKTVLNKIICPNLRKAVICVTRHTKNCMNLETGKEFQKLFDNTNQMVQRLCHDKFFQNEYLMHTKCIKQISNNNKQCFRQYETTLRKVTSDQNIDEKNIKKLCCSLKDYIDCSSDSVFEVCGPVASQFARNFLTNMSFTLNDAYCKNFAENCDKSMSTLLNCNSILIFGVILIIIIYQNCR